MGLFGWGKKLELPTLAEALPGRSTPLRVAERHAVLGTSMQGPWPGMEQAIFAMGCFWGVERIFWKVPGVVSTAAGYAGGFTPNPTYEEVCSGHTGHTEVVRVIFDPTRTSYDALLQVFWENHDPTQGMRQGNDVGTQYRSAIYTFGEAQAEAAQRTLRGFQARLKERGYGAVTTEVEAAGEFWLAEDYHQQYLEKNPDGYCGIGGTGVSCPIGTGA